MPEQEAIALNQDLKANQQLLEEMVVVVRNVEDELATHSQEMKDNANMREEQAEQTDEVTHVTEA